MDIYDELLDAQQPEPQPAQGGDAYDAILDDFQAKQARQLEVNLDRALAVMPQKAATVQQLSTATGLPEELVERNFDLVQKQVRVREMQSVLAASPILARQMADPAFAQLAHEDLENLSLIERLPRQFVGGGIETIGRTIGGIGELGDVAQRNLINLLAGALLPEPAHGERPTPESLAGPMIGEGWRGAGDLVKDFARDDVMIPGAQQTFTDQVAAGVGQVGAQILLYYLTGGAAGTASMYAQGADIMAERVEGDDAPQWRKDLAVVGGAAITGLTEKWALDRILGPLAVPVKNQLGAALVRIGVAGASEGGQEFVENILHEVLRQQLTNPDAEISIAGALEEAEVGAAVGVIVRSIIESALRVRVRHQQLEQQANEAEVNAAQIEQLNQLAAANKMLQLSPESFEQFVEAAAEEGPVQGIFIDAQTLMQSGVAEEIAAVSPAVAEQLRDAVASGGLINIPVAEYAARIAPTEYAQSLLDHIKTDPNGFTRAEAREYMQSQAEQLEADLAERIANAEEQDEFRASQERVKQTVLAELNALGRFTEQKNELDATLIAARTAVRAAQLGTTPEELFERQRLRFAAERIDGQQFDQGALQQFGILESDLSLPVDELIARNEETPVNSMEPGVAQDLPLGSIRVAPYGGDMDERYVDVLTEVPVDSLLIAEPEDSIRSTPEYQQYVQWALEGREAPLIQVSQNERGEYVAANRRRALAAREAGIPTLRAWVSPINPATGDPLKYGDLRGQRYNQQPFGGPEEPRTPLPEGTTEIEVDGVQRPTLNSAGRPIHPTVEGVRNFWRWFGDSKAVDEQGRPLVVYHGSPDLRFVNEDGVFRSQNERFGMGSTDAAHWFASSEATAKSYADPRRALDYQNAEEGVLAAYIKIENPLIVDGAGGNWYDVQRRGNASDVIEEARANGHDGVIIRNVKDDYNNSASTRPTDTYVVFNSTQIKSATDNVGTFDPNDPRILYQSGLQQQTAADLARRLREEFPGLKLDLMGRGDRATLSRIVVPQDGREQGTGTQVMQRIVQWADANGVTLALTPSSDFGGNKKRLTEFYKRFGFVENKGRNKDYEISESMYRPAQEYNQSAPSYVAGVDEIQAGEDALRLAEELLDQGAQITPDGRVRVFHRTTAQAAETIRATGQMTAREDGLFFSTREDGQAEGYGDTAVEMHIPLDRLVLDDVFGDEAHVRVPLERAGQKIGVAEWLGSYNQSAQQGYTVEQLQEMEFDDLSRMAFGYATGDIVELDPSQLTVRYEEDLENPRARFDEEGMEWAESVDLSEPIRVQVQEDGSLTIEDGHHRYFAAQQTGRKLLAEIEVNGNPVRAILRKQEQGKTYNQPAARGPRGAFNPETNTIALLKNADLSTFLHEAGHYFFEADIALASELVQEGNVFGEQVLTEGERQILTDVSALLRWHGIQGSIEEQLNTWHNMPFEEKRSAHERTAESFEAYLFSGQAPSIELQPYFQRFREFLKRVYTDLKNFLSRHPEAGKLNDEVRAVFDRMLATDEQIELAQRARSMFPLFRTEAEAANIGMTPEEFAAYQAQDPQATADAVQDLQARGLRDLQWTRNARNREIRKLKKQAAALRSEVQMEVRREVLSQPVYRAWQFLTAKITDEDRITPRERPKSDPDHVDPTMDPLLTAIAKLGGLNKEELVATWGIDPAERPSSGVFGKPVLRREGGRSIDAMAEALGELGYLPKDEHGKVDVRDLEERFDAALRGEDVYSDLVDAELLFDPVPGTSVNPEALTAGRLDLGALAEMDVKQEVVDALKARRMTAKDGIHPDLLFGLFGFSSSEQMLRELVEATPPREEIEARTDARMLEQYGELATPEAIEIEADKAIHNEARARMIATEANALAKAVGQRRVLAQAAKAFAQTMVARVKIRDIRPSQYANAEARAAKAAEKASRAGDLVQAAAEKRTQLVNNYATRAAYDAREEVDKGLRFLNKFNREGSRKGLDPEYLEQIDTLLERFDLRRGESLRAIDKRTNLAQWIANQEQAGLDPDLPDYILAEANRTHYKNLTVEEFRGLVESVRQIEHLGRLKKKLLTAKDQRELDAIVEELRERIEQSSDGRIVDNERRNTTRSWMNHLFRGALAAHRKAASVVREMDGFEEGGPLWERIIRPMNERGEWEVTMRADAAQRLHDLAKPVLALGPMGGNGDYFPTLGRSLNRGERIAIALNYGNESNRQRLLSGRNWTDAQIQPVLSSLTATEWQFVQGVWEFFESYRPEIAAKERRVYGKEPDWIEPSPFTVRTADGQTLEIAGGYYPIKYDPRQSGKAGEFAEAEEAKAMMRAAYTAATTRRSFTKSRAEEVHGRPLLLTFDGIWQGANEVIHDLAWHEWLIDVNRLMKRLDSAIRTHYGAEYVDVLRNTIKDVARGDLPAANAIEAALTHVRNGSSIVGMGWNLITALLQPLGIANSIVRVGNGSNREGAKWIAKGMSQFYGSPRHMLDKVREVQAMSEFMANRSRTMNREIADVRNRLETGKSDFQMKLEGTYFLLIQRMQELVDYPTWLGAYEKAIADPKNLNPDGTIDEARAVALADQAVIDSQSAGTIKDLAQVQRGHPAMKLFTNFYSYFSVLLNLSVEQGKIRVQRKDYAGLMSDYLILIVAPAVLSAVMREALKGQDDEDEYLKAVASELVGYPFGMFVLGRELSTAAQLAAGVGNPAFGYSGPAGLRFFSEITKLGQQVGQGDLDMALFKAANNVGGILFHYPAGQVNRFVDGTAALIEGRTENPLAPLVGPPPR